MVERLMQRCAVSLLLFWLVLSLTFLFINAIPGDPAALLVNPHLPRAQQLHLHRIFGLDRPLAVQYWQWLSAVLGRGDWGISFVYQQPVTQILFQAIPSSLL